MRVSVVNFCSTALQMLEFSSDMLLLNAGTDDFDYIVVTWNPSPEVVKWLSDRQGIKRVDYFTNPNLAYVPNLRKMMSKGFDAGYEINDWVAIVNTDMAFGRDWLVNLMRWATEDIIPNSLHMSPITGPNIITMDFGTPRRGSFLIEDFWTAHDQLWKDKIELEEERGGWKACATMPYIVHKKWWQEYGPWEPEYGSGHTPPDQRFFERCHKGGAKFVLVHSSIVYHHETVERRSGKRPVGVENMPEGR